MVNKSYPAEWKLVKLSDLGEVNRGRSRHRPRYAEHLYGGPYPFIQTGDIKASAGRITSYQQTYSEAGLAQSRLWPSGTMCITIAANIAETGILTFPACFPDSVIGFIADESKCDVYFIEYMFRHLKSYLQHQASGSVQDNINLATLERLQFPLPPLDEQKAIAHILGTLDDKIELNQQMNQTLAAIQWTLFKSWFTESDFPDDWQLLPLEECMEAIIDYRGKTPKKTESGIPLITAKIVKNGRINQPQEFIALDDYDGWMRRGIPKRGDVVMTTEAPLGEIARLNGKKVALAQRLITLRSKSGLLDNTYLKFLMQSSFVQDQLHARASGSTVLGIKQSELRQITLPVAPFIEQEQMMAPLKVLEDKIDANEEESLTLAKIRDALLPKLLSGDVPLRKAQKVLEVVA